MACFLVTGGAGFIGSNIVAELVKQDCEIKVLDNFFTGKRENLSQFLDKIELMEGDLRDLETVKKVSRDVDYVLHQGALPSVSHSIEDPLTNHDVNVAGTLNVLIAARESKVKRVVYASSCAVYGGGPTLPKTEGMREEPLSPYAVSKLAGEHYCRIFYSAYGLETVSLRFFNVFGPRQDPTSEYAAVIPKFIDQMLGGEAPTIYGDGTQSRDFVYVGDVVDACLMALYSEKIAGQVFNIGSGKSHSINDLVALLNRVMDTDIKSQHSDARPGDIKHSLADISKAKQLLGYTPATSFVDGLKETVEWYRSNAW